MESSNAEKINFQQIKVSEAYESPNNPRGNDFEGPSFDDLIASIKEKGILVPVIARPKKIKGKEYEIIAGNRRFRAAQMAGLDEIPARIQELTDDEAAEVQIIENLQREDVHPIEEGKAYRQLAENFKLSVSEIAQRVGKSDSYVRYRLFLTNLTDKAANAFRKWKITDGHAVLIAKLSPNDQGEALKYALGNWNGMRTVKELKEWIMRKFYKPLAFQPWLKDSEIAEAVGPCKECPPDTGTLFGDRKDGACIDLKCWTRKINNYIEYEIVKAQDQGEELLKVSKEYGTPEGKGVLSKSNYQTLSTKKKEHCDSAQQGIVAEGPDTGTKIWICADPKCKIHGSNHTLYRQTPEEKEARKKEIAKEKARKEKEDKNFLAALELIEFPITSSNLNALFEMGMNIAGSDIHRKVAKRHGFDPHIDITKGYDGKERKSRNWEKPIRDAVLSDEVQKMRICFELLIERIWNRDEILKMLKS